MSKTTSHTIEPPGDVARLSVAVLIDDNREMKTDAEGKASVSRVPRSQEELQKLFALVSTAVGGGLHVADEAIGADVVADADRAAKGIAKQLSGLFAREGWTS